MIIGDMKVLHKTEYKHHHQYYLVECVICGKQREVSLPNLKRRGNTHSEHTCREGYLKAYIGNRYGDYEVIGYDDSTNKLVLQCTCCGNQYKCYLSGLSPKQHNASTCGYSYYQSKLNIRYGDFITQTYLGVNSYHKYICKCIYCGREREIRLTDLEKGKFTHIHCSDLLPKDAVYKTLQQRYQNILARCNKPNHSSYKYYGAKGIKCEFNSFIDFYDTYSEAINSNLNLTFDRIDVSGNYSIENLRLVDYKVQQSNKTTTRYFLAFKDEEKVLCNNAMEFGRYANINGRSVGNCLRGNSKTSGGWQFINLTLEDFSKLLNDRSVTTKLIV